MTSVICSICVNEVCDTRRNVECGYCQFSACSSCYETYLLSQDRVHCMNNDCKRDWSRQFLTANFSKTFVNGVLKKHRENVLYDSEKSLLPATQLVIEENKRVAKINQQIVCNKADRDVADAKMKLYSVALKGIGKKSKVDAEYAKREDNQHKIKEFRKEYEKYRKEGSSLHSLIRSLENELRNNKIVTKTTFIRACSVPDCRGFLDEKWKCGLCYQFTCSTCLVVKGFEKSAEHTCLPDDVATASLLASNTKPCPSCSEGIFKISGCDHMFCTKCHTAFSWTTGAITQHTSNPHYWEWLRQTRGAVPRDQQDVPPCDAPIGRDTLSSLVRMLGTASMGDTYIRTISKIIESYFHLLHITLPRYATNPVINNENLRIKFMLKEIDEATFKLKLQQANKAFEKKREVHQILTTFITALGDILNNFRVKIIGRGNTEVLAFCPLAEINSLVEYVNGSFKELAEVYDSDELYIELRTPERDNLHYRQSILYTIKTKSSEHYKQFSKRSSTFIATLNERFPIVEDTNQLSSSSSSSSSSAVV